MTPLSKTQRQVLEKMREREGHFVLRDNPNVTASNSMLKLVDGLKEYPVLVHTFSALKEANFIEEIGANPFVLTYTITPLGIEALEGK